MNHRSHKKNQSGFTLIELLIAIAVFSIGIMAAFTLALGNWRVDKQNYDRVMAGNLAREGIELVRYVRDSNWLKMDNNEECEGVVCHWDSYMDTEPDDRRLLVDYESFSSLAPFKFVSSGCGGTIEDCIDHCDDSDSWCVLQYDHTAGFESRFFYHDLVNSDYLTNFKRVIDLEAICYDNNGGTGEYIETEKIDCIDVADEKIGLNDLCGWLVFFWRRIQC